MTAQRATQLATPVDLRGHRTASDDGLAARFHPDYRAAIGRVPAGDQVFRGLPFGLAPAGSGPRWLLLEDAVAIDLRPAGPASHIVIAHFCDAWRDAGAERPADLPIGWVTPVGQPLARYTLELASGRVLETVVRRRFEINEGIVGWGQNAFDALPHLVDQPLDWRGPHPAIPPAVYARPGEAGLLGVLPGSWGPGQTGVADSVPSPTGEIMLWLHVIAVPGGAAEIVRLGMEPLARIEEGGGVVVAAVTAFRGLASPLHVEPRRTLRIRPDPPDTVAVDLGHVFRERAVGERPASPVVAGWGVPRGDRSPTSRLVDLAFAPDATLAIDGQSVPAAELPPEGADGRRFGRLTIESLPAPTRRVDVEVIDARTGKPIAARVRFEAADGRYLPPLGHRDEVNPGLNEDTGADLVIGDHTYAYVPGRFP
ncbi:MAG TPA: hypothetical protein VH720_03270, partial [Candidatus Limnocylindrales bacterium]